jgi:uridylate kinase
VLLKVSGEALAGGHGTGFHFDTLERIADDIKQVVDMGIGIGLVIGGGNIVR